MTRPPSQTLGVRIPTETKREFEDLCKARGTTASKQVRAWVEYTVAEEQQRVAAAGEAAPAGADNAGADDSGAPAGEKRKARAPESRAIPAGKTRVRCFLTAEEVAAVEADCTRLERMTRNDWLVRAVRSMLLKRPELTGEEMVLMATVAGEARRLNTHLDKVIPLPNPNTGQARMAVLDANLLQASRLASRQIVDAWNRVMSQSRDRWLDR